LDHPQGARLRLVLTLRRLHTRCHRPAWPGDPVGRGSSDQSRARGVLDAPPEPVLGLAEGETRGRGMTAVELAMTSPGIHNTHDLAFSRRMPRPSDPSV